MPRKATYLQRITQRQIDRDHNLAVKLQQEQHNTHPGTYQATRSNKRRTLLKRPTQVGQCQTCGDTSELYGTCTEHTGCATCIQAYVRTQLPTRAMKCLGCAGEMSIDAINAVMPLDEMGAIQTHYNRRNMPYTQVPSRCPQCLTQVERSSGCSYIICRCGAHFCYNCGDFIKVCNATGCKMTWLSRLTRHFTSENVTAMGVGMVTIVIVLMIISMLWPVITMIRSGIYPGSTSCTIILGHLGITRCDYNTINASTFNSFTKHNCCVSMAPLTVGNYAADCNTTYTCREVLDAIGNRTVSATELEAIMTDATCSA